jgi:hypothetical protein
VTRADLPETEVLDSVTVDDVSTVPAWTYDPELPDQPGLPWRLDPCRCKACGLVWLAVWRADTRTPTCPRCVTTDRSLEELQP